MVVGTNTEPLLYPNVASIIASYDPKNEKYIGLDTQVMIKRVHSKGYHNMKSYCKQRFADMTANAILTKSQSFAIECSNKWKETYVQP